MTTAAVSLPPPRRKTRVREAPGATLPLPSALPHPSCTHYQATYSLGHITIHDLRQAEALWHNGYYGHGMEGSRSGRSKVQKKWRLVEADGLKSGKWFREAHEAGRRRRGKGEIVEKEEEREEEMEMENTDKEEKINVKEKKESDKMEDKSQNMEEEDALNKENNDKSVKEEEKKDEEPETSMRQNKEGVGTENKNSISSQHPEDRDEDLTKNNKEEMEILSDSNDSEPWRTVLVLSGDQQAGKDANSPHTYLTLLPEEALFLSYALGCLVLTYTESPASRRSGKRPLEEHDSHEMTIDEMWRVFCQDDPAFPVKYAAYHHFRTQGWVVKAGLKYGVDYVLYPVGPPFYHSQYAVKIHSVWADTLTLDHSLPGHAMTWTTIATTERLSNHINKTPVICFVLRPRSLTQPHLGRIECLKELKVQEMVLGRWNASDGSG